MDVVALRLGEGIAAAADVVGGFEALHQAHETLLDLVGELHELRGLVEALQLLDRRAAEVGRAVEGVKSRSAGRGGLAPR